MTVVIFIHSTASRAQNSSHSMWNTHPDRWHAWRVGRPLPSFPTHLVGHIWLHQQAALSTDKCLLDGLVHEDDILRSMDVDLEQLLHTPRQGSVV
jgi:hypothetical protein